MDCNGPALRRAILVSVVFLAALFAAKGLKAQTPAGSFLARAVSQADIAKLDQRISAAQSSGDNAWMIVSAALVLMMTGPGMAMCYGGPVGQKKPPGAMIQKFRPLGV